MNYDSSKESTIELLGITGIVATIACGIHHMAMVQYISTWMQFASITVDLFVLVSFVLFFRMKTYSAPMLIGSTVLLVVLQAFFLRWGGIIWLSVALTAFTIVVLVMLYIQELNSYMQEYQLEQKRGRFIP